MKEINMLEKKYRETKKWYDLKRMLVYKKNGFSSMVLNIMHAVKENISR